jgi:hypothetical protein
MRGGSRSCTMTAKVHAADSSEASRASQLTLYVPIVKSPGCGEHVKMICASSSAVSDERTQREKKERKRRERERERQTERQTE